MILEQRSCALFAYLLVLFFSFGHCLAELPFYNDREPLQFLEHLSASYGLSEKCAQSLDRLFSFMDNWEAQNESDYRTLWIRSFIVEPTSHYMSAKTFQYKWAYGSLSCLHSAGASASSYVSSGRHYSFCHVHLSTADTVGVCIPSKCEREAGLIILAWYQFLNGNFGSTLLQPTLSSDVACIKSEREKQWYDRSAPYWCFLFLSAVVLIGVCGHCYEKWFQKEAEQSVFLKLLLAHSVGANVKRLLRKDANDSISCLHGLRVFGILWVMLNHSYYIRTMFTSNVEQMNTELKRSFLGQVVTNSALSVDIFFTLSGLLAAYCWFKPLWETPEASRPTWRSWRHWLGHFRHRLVRIWPFYLGLLMTVTHFFSLLMPFQTWPTVDLHHQCKIHWWENALFLNWLWPPHCLLWSWYIGADFVQFAFSPFLFLLLKWRAKAAAVIISVLIISSVVVTSMVTFVHNFPPFQFNWNQPDFDRNAMLIYYAPYTHAGPYLLGIASGYMLSFKRCTFESSNFCFWKQISAWSTVTFAVLAALFGQHPCFQGWNGWNSYCAIYAGSHRTIFALSLCALIFLCESGRGKIINAFFSLRAWQILSKISYAAYLIHCIFFILLFLLLFPVEWNGHGFHLLLFMAQIPVSFGVAAVATVLCEMPPVTFEKFIFGNRNKSKLV